MRNQPFNSVVEDSPAGNIDLIDLATGRRFAWLLTGFAVAGVAVLFRIGWVQAKVQPRYLAVLNSTVEEFEEIPSRNGRILTDTSVVLATDVEQFSLQIHYRWLQDPVDEDWLKRRIRQLLPREERKDDQLVDSEEAKLRTQRATMWARVAQQGGLTPEEFRQKQSRIQHKVQSIADAVNERHRIKGGRTDATQHGNPLLQFVAGMRSALTKTSSRGRRIVVREEEDYHEFLSPVSFDIAARIREQPHLFPGVRVVDTSRRAYPEESLAAHIVGARKNETGKFGVELTHNHQLRGRPGLKRILRTRRMETVETTVVREPISGSDVMLTLNENLQRHAQRLLDEALLERPQELLSRKASENRPMPIPTGGAVIVMDVHSGRIVAAASAPTFSLKLYSRAQQADWDRLNKDPRSPFLSRLVQGSLPPGSVIKPFVAASAIESGVVSANTPFRCDGYLTTPDQHRCMVFRLHGHGHGPVTLPTALAMSCNVYFFSAAQQMGYGDLRDWLDRFGFGRETGITLPFEIAGKLPGTRRTAMENEERYRSEALGVSVGQGRMTATPLQVVRAMAAVANGGWLVTPHVVNSDAGVRSIDATDISEASTTSGRTRIRGLSNETLAAIREGLFRAVNDPIGTAYRTVRLEDVAIAGKTGTAETGSSRPDHAWFSGYVPAADPQFAVTVVLEHGGSGSLAAGPVAREIIRHMKVLELLP